MTRPMNSSSTLGMSAPARGSDHADGGRFIYLAVPWGPVGGGMYKVVDYLIQSQGEREGGPVLRALDTRGSGSAAASMVQVLRAVGAVVRARIGGRLAGVHVNMAERLDLLRGFIVLAACRALRVPTVLHLHAAQLHHGYRRLPGPLRAGVRWLFSLPQACVVLGQASAAFVTQELRVPAAKVEIVVNGVPEPALPRGHADRPGTTALGSDVAQVLFVGNLSERKGVSDLLQALAQPALADVPLKLTLVGGGDVAGYTAKAEQLGVAHKVQFHGWADQQQVAKLLAASDAFVLPSHDEGLPLAILEALAHGVAVVCTPVGEIPHVLAHRRDACFVEPGNPASIARGLADVLTGRELREQLERNGRALHEAQFSLTRFAAVVARIHQRQFGLSAQPPARGADAPA